MKKLTGYIIFNRSKTGKIKFVPSGYDSEVSFYSNKKAAKSNCFYDYKDGSKDFIYKVDIFVEG